MDTMYFEKETWGGGWFLITESKKKPVVDGDLCGRFGKTKQYFDELFEEAQKDFPELVSKDTNIVELRPKSDELTKFQGLLFWQDESVPIPESYDKVDPLEKYLFDQVTQMMLLRKDVCEEIPGK